MNRFFIRASLGALALAAPVLASSNAFAATTCTTSQGVVTITDPTTCHFETSGGCTAMCTPVNFTATCNDSCTATATTTCTDTCQATCNTACTAEPTTFVCKDYCSTDCEPSCAASCTGDSCAADCSASCDTQCTETCAVHPGAIDCTTMCQDSCTGSCNVDASIQCSVDCTTALTGGCTTKCSEPTGSLFCDGQFIDVASVTDCSFSLTTTVTTTAKTGCAVAPGESAPLGIPAGLAVMAGLGMAAARRRRRP